MKAKKKYRERGENRQLAMSGDPLNLIKGSDEGECVSVTRAVSVLLIEGSPRSH